MYLQRRVDPTLNEPEKQTISSHGEDELTAKDDSGVKCKGSLVGHVDDVTALGVVIETGSTPYWCNVFWTVPPNLTTNGKIGNALRQALEKEIYKHVDKQRLLRTIADVMQVVQQRGLISSWKTDFVTNPSSTGCHINLSYSMYGKAGYTVVTINVH